MSKLGFHHHPRRSKAANLWLAMRHPALRWHEHETGLCVERRNLDVLKTEKGTSHRKMRPKVEMGRTGTEMFVVVMKFL